MWLLYLYVGSAGARPFVVPWNESARLHIIRYRNCLQCYFSKSHLCVRVLFSSLYQCSQKQSMIALQTPTLFVFIVTRFVAPSRHVWLTSHNCQTITYVMLLWAPRYERLYMFSCIEGTTPAVLATPMCELASVTGLPRFWTIKEGRAHQTLTDDHLATKLQSKYIYCVAFTPKNITI